MLRFFFNLAYALLVLRFVYGIFEPGPGGLQPIYQALQPIMPAVYTLTNWLMFPVVWFMQQLTPMLPPSILEWFPLTPTGPAIALIMGLIGAIPGVHGTDLDRMLTQQPYPAIFPGALDWQIVLTSSLLSGVERLLFSVLSPVNAWFGGYGRKLIGSSH